LLAIEPGNSSFSVKGDFLFDIFILMLICYFGSKSSIVISGRVETLGSKVCLFWITFIDLVWIWFAAEAHRIWSVLQHAPWFDVFSARCPLSPSGDSYAEFDEWKLRPERDHVAILSSPSISLSASRLCRLGALV
jgi:hypothetical protein